MDTVQHVIKAITLKTLTILDTPGRFTIIDLPLRPLLPECLGYDAFRI